MAKRSRIATAKKVTKYTAGGILTAQAVAAAGLVAVDEWRKRRSPSGPLSFPALAPKDLAVSDNQLTTYMDARELYDDMIYAISNAKSYVFFESFIWKGDNTGQRFKDALIAAARRGVDVFIIYDGFGNLVVPPRFKRFPKLEHLHVLQFPILKFGIFKRGLRAMGRDHRKIVVADGKIGFVGGYNIGEIYIDQWRDTHLRIEGPGVWELDNAFVDFWNEHCKGSQKHLFDRGTRSWDNKITAALNTPRKLLFPVRGSYINAIERASKRVWITSAYFIPDSQIQDALLAAAHRGVDVRILVPEKSNHLIADWAARSFYAELLESGAQLWLYQDVMIHAKTMTVDGRWSTIGTANIDQLSMTGNYEINLQITDREQAAYLEKVFLEDLTNAREMSLLEWESRGAFVRMTERLVRPLRYIL